MARSPFHIYNPSLFHLPNKDLRFDESQALWRYFVVRVLAFTSCYGLLLKEQTSIIAQNV